MSEINDTPAFPTMQYAHGGEADGMSMRDYFAAKAMQGLLSDSDSGLRYEDVPRLAYQLADGMLIVRAENE